MALYSCCRTHLYNHLFFAYQKNRYKCNLFNLLTIIRNVSPVITGVILSLICYPFMKKINHRYLKWILLALLLLPTLSGIDSLGLSDGYSISFTFILFYLGVIEASEEKRFSIISLILLCLMNVLCVTMMPLCSKIVHGDMSTALRFTTSTSFFEVMIAIYFYSSFKKCSIL